MSGISDTFDGAMKIGRDLKTGAGGWRLGAGRKRKKRGWGLVRNGDGRQEKSRLETRGWGLARVGNGRQETGDWRRETETGDGKESG